MSIVVIRLRVPAEHLEFGRVLRDGPDLRIELTQLVPIGANVVPYFWAETADPESFEEAVRSDDQVRTLERLQDGPEKYLYRIEWVTAPDGFFTALREHGLVVERATGTPDEWQFQLRGPDNENLSEFQERLREFGIPHTVSGVWNPTAPNGLYGLTDKQRQAVTLAFSEGYFEVPAETNLTELAERVGISRQSFSRRLTRGLRAILANTVMADE